LLRQWIRGSEKTGTHGVRPHSALGKGTYLGELAVANNVTVQGDGHRGRIVLGLDSHTTLWELKKRLGEELVKVSKDDGKTWEIPPSLKPVHPATIRIY